MTGESLHHTHTALIMHGFLLRFFAAASSSRNNRIAHHPCAPEHDPERVSSCPRILALETRPRASRAVSLRGSPGDVRAFGSAVRRSWSCQMCRYVRLVSGPRRARVSRRRETEGRPRIDLVASCSGCAEFVVWGFRCSWDGGEFG